MTLRKFANTDDKKKAKACSLNPEIPPFPRSDGLLLHVALAEQAVLKDGESEDQGGNERDIWLWGESFEGILQ